MFYEFYFRINKLTNRSRISLYLARIAYFLYVCKFFVLKMFRKKENCNLSPNEAHSIIDHVYEKPEKRICIVYNRQVDPDIDLSIIIPVYNNIDYIKDNIESVRNQKTEYRYEIIIVDDGSTDGASDIVSEYNNYDNIRIIRQENQGIAAARNTGIQNSCGKYLMFVDCDDIIHDDMVQTLLTHAYENDRDIVMCGHNLVKEVNGKIYQIVPYVYPDLKELGLYTKDDIMNYSGLPWGKIYKRELWDNVRFIPGYWFEDTIIQWLIFSQCKNFEYISKIEYEYRWFENNFSKIQGKAHNVKSIDRYWMLLDIIEIYKELNLPLDGRFYKLLLKHLSTYYYPSIRYLDDYIIDAMFILAKELMEKYKYTAPSKLPYMLRITEKALIKGDISLWKLASLFQ